MKYDFSVVIIRGEPLHKAHLKIIDYALVIAKNTIVIFGSHRGAPSIKNPWTFEQRKEMLLACVDEDSKDKLCILAVRDHPYNDNVWLAEVHAKVRTIINSFRPHAKGWTAYGSGTGAQPKIALVGYKKDASSFYLDLFKQWEFEDTGSFSKGVSATDIRKSYFLEDILEEFKEADTEESDRKINVQHKVYADVIKHCCKYNWRDYVPEPVIKYLNEFKKTELFSNLQKDFKYVVNYKAKWEHTPFPVTFTTVDALIVKSGHVLVIRRKNNPGKDLIALPGGFIAQHERIADAAIRELYEETELGMRVDELKKHLKESYVFDHPDRSQRGRVITHAYYFELPNKGELPEVRGGDDAKEAFWMPLGDLGFMEDQIFEDHLSIIQFFTTRR